MNSNWVVNRVGLINFWYYDDEEFTLSKGRMLLRGANGSGKSVTMQSLVPLLLDGNMRPERLDPFGSRDRKMVNYLLEENDERDERTAYLYMEFKRENSETYHTIGIGMRARKNKPLDNWYFHISDGRRIKKDLFLYKGKENRIVLTKNELKNQLSQGGGIFDTQREYMAHVNKFVFGFGSSEEYKDMIELLLQLRTPKLSKDFKPTIVNEILSDSLQPLTEDDLRPMSEAIENMETISTNLESKKRSKSSADKINKIYETYNIFMLVDTASTYKQSKEALKKVNNLLIDSNKKLQKSKETVIKMNEYIENLDNEKNILEKEKDSLNSSNAVYLKGQLEELNIKIKKYYENKIEKENNLENKNEKYVSNNNLIKNESEIKEKNKKELEEILELMYEYADSSALEQLEFIVNDIKASLEKATDYVDDDKTIEDLKIKIEKGKKILEEVEVGRKDIDAFQLKLDKNKTERTRLAEQVNAWEMQLAETQNVMKEKINDWHNKNEELKLSKNTLMWISNFIDMYNKKSDYNDISQKLFNEEYEIKGKIQIQKSRFEQEKETLLNDQKLLEQEIENWKNKKEPEPEISESTKKNREELTKRGIKFYELYKIIDFKTMVDEQTQNNIEEALLNMGILDSIIIDEKYREQALSLGKGFSDKYIFDSKDNLSRNILKVFDIEENISKEEYYEKILEIIGRIGYTEIKEQNSSNFTNIDANGNFEIGVITGKITGDYKAKYIGVKARENHKKAKILSLEEEKQNILVKVEEVEKEIYRLEDKIKKITEEYQLFPKGEDIKAAVNGLTEATYAFNKAQDLVQEIQNEMDVMIQKNKIRWEEALDVSGNLGLNCKLEVFSNANEALKEYQRNYFKAKEVHNKYMNGNIRIAYLNENKESLEDDIDNLRSDIIKIDRDLKKSDLEKVSIEEQLALTDYEDVKQRLDICIKRLNGIPYERDSYVKTREENVNIANNLENLIEEKLIEKDKHEISENTSKKIFWSEYTSSYVDLDFLKNSKGEESEKVETIEIDENNKNIEETEKLNEIVEEIIDKYSDNILNKKKDDIKDKLQQVYYENRGDLIEYNIRIENKTIDELNENESSFSRMEILGKYQGNNIKFKKLVELLKEEIEGITASLKYKERELFEDILANTISTKIRVKINSSKAWVEKMNTLMSSMNTSSGLSLSLKWRNKKAEYENQLDTVELVKLLTKDSKIMTENEMEKLTTHFRSKINEAGRRKQDSLIEQSTYARIRESLDYRKWFEFQLFYQKIGDPLKPLTNSVFGTFSGGEKAMAMYVPLFSAVAAKYSSARIDAPMIISLDEAFAGVDSRNIKDMFRLMVEFKFNFIINSQILWGDYETLDGLSIYQLLRPENAKCVTVIPYIWDGFVKNEVGD